MKGLSFTQILHLSERSVVDTTCWVGEIPKPEGLMHHQSSQHETNLVKIVSQEKHAPGPTEPAFWLDRTIWKTKP